MVRSCVEHLDVEGCDIVALQELLLVVIQFEDRFPEINGTFRNLHNHGGGSRMGGTGK